MKLFNVKSLSSAQNWFAILEEKKGIATFRPVLAWVALDQGDKDDEIGGAVLQDDGSIVIMGEWCANLAGFALDGMLEASAAKHGLKMESSI